MSKINPVRDLTDSTMLSRPGLVRPRVEIHNADGTKTIRQFTVDSYMTFDQMTIDSTGSFLVGELERLDPTLHEPLVSITWPRDIDLREDVTAADEVSSFTNSSFAAPGGIYPAGKNWVSKDANSIAGIALDIGKTANPLYLWAMETKWTLPELASAEKLGRPIDTEKYNGMKLKHQMDTDEQVYIGDAYYNVPGLFTYTTAGGAPAASAITPITAPNGGMGSPLWTTKTPDEILADVNALLNAVWATSGYAIMPQELRLPPTQFSYLVSQKVSTAGNVSILEFLRNNSLANAANGKPLNIQPVKWLAQRGAGSTNRMVAYTRDKDRVRFQMVPLQRTPVEYRSLFQIVTYWGRLGVVEFPYVETVGYMDGI